MASDSRDVLARIDSEKERYLEELKDYIRIPSISTDPDFKADVVRASEFLVGKLREAGLQAERIDTAGHPLVYAEWLGAPGKPTILFYGHYDVQPVDPIELWRNPPFEPTVEGDKLVARGATDDKGQSYAHVKAVAALLAERGKLPVNVKFLVEGEEEAGGAAIEEYVKQDGGKRLKADAVVISDSSLFAPGQPSLIYGLKGLCYTEIKVTGPNRDLHSGTYGGALWNPLNALCHIVDGLRDAKTGKILIPGFYDDVRPLNAAEKAAVAAMPPVEEALRDELALGRTEGSGARLQERLMDPALNVRGLRSAEVGEGAANAIPTEAQASIDFRLVPDQTPQKVRDRVEAFLRGQGWTLVTEAPSREVRRAHPRVARLAWSLDYPGARTDMSLPVSRAIAAVVDRAVGGSAIQVPMLGGSVPMVLFTETLKVPVIGVPIVNHDNNQHGINENLRLQNLWDGIEVFAALMAELGREWR